MKFLYMFMQTFAIIRPTQVRVPHKCKLAKNLYYSLLGRDYLITISIKQFASSLFEKKPLTLGYLKYLI